MMNTSISIKEEGVIMKQELYFVIRDSLDGGYEAQALHEAIFTQADTYEELKESIRDAINCHFDDKNSPHIVHLHDVRDEVMAV
jgi:predicted RNase H-like HicB family nuclease